MILFNIKGIYEGGLFKKYIIRNLCMWIFKKYEGILTGAFLKINLEIYYRDFFKLFF